MPFWIESGCNPSPEPKHWRQPSYFANDPNLNNVSKDHNTNLQSTRSKNLSASRIGPHTKLVSFLLANLLSEYCPGGLMTTSLNEEAVQRNESLERDPTIVDSIRTVLLHHSLSQDIREVIMGYIPRLFIPSGQFFCTTACHRT